MENFIDCVRHYLMNGFWDPSCISVYKKKWKLHCLSITCRIMYGCLNGLNLLQPSNYIYSKIKIRLFMKKFFLLRNQLRRNVEIRIKSSNFSSCWSIFVKFPTLWISLSKSNWKNCVGATLKIGRTSFCIGVSEYKKNCNY